MAINLNEEKRRAHFMSTSQIFASSFGWQTIEMLIELIAQQSNVMIKLMLLIFFGWNKQTLEYQSTRSIVTINNIFEATLITLKRIKFKLNFSLFATKTI